MRTPIFQLDAFTRPPICGNPAAVMPMDSFLADETLQAIAAENNLAETAFPCPLQRRLSLAAGSRPPPRCRFAAMPRWPAQRWSWERLAWTQQGGLSLGERALNGEAGGCRLRNGLPGPAVRGRLDTMRTAEALGIVPIEVVVSDFNYMAVIESGQVLRALAPDMTALARMDRGGLIVTAPGDGNYDFFSRYFAPAKGIPEDPVNRFCALHAGALLGQTAGQN